MVTRKQKKVVFVRHSLTLGDGTTNPDLSPEGIEVAKQAVAWLKGQDFDPDLVVTSQWDRCKQTGQVFADAYGCGIIHQGGIPTRKEHFLNLLARFDRTEHVILVGSHPTQELLVRKFGAPRLFRKLKCATFLLERPFVNGVSTGWTCVAHWPGKARSSEG